MNSPVSLPFGKIAFIREIISNRHSKSTLKNNYHQIDINIHFHIDSNIKLISVNTDTYQVGLIWYKLDSQHEINFFPHGLINNFKK